MEKRLNNFYYVNSFSFSPFNKGFWDSFQNQQISNNFIKNKAKEQKVIMKLLNFKRLYYRNYLTLKDFDQDQKDPVFEYLKKLAPSVFQDGVLNFDLLKQHLEPNQIIKESNDFGLFWNGKNLAKSNAFLELRSKTLFPIREQSLNFDQAENILIEGDNLEALKILEKSYFNQVDVIYIDPPYNTGNDFVYNDDFKQSIEEYQIENNFVNDEGFKTTTNQNTSGRFHTNWLNMIYPRLMIARNLLKDGGVIFISIDNNEQARLKLICDEIFGEHNFINTLLRETKTGGGRFGKQYIQTDFDYVLCYSKNILKTDEFSKMKSDWDDYKFNDQRGDYSLKHPLDGGAGQKNYDFEIIIQNNIYKPRFEKNWSFSKKRIDFMIEQDFLVPKNNGIVYIKNYKNWEIIDEDNQYKIVWKENGISWSSTKLIDKKFNNANGNKDIEYLNLKENFSYPKPVTLIKSLINMIKNKNALVLDFFAGSGTTAQAVMELNQEDGGNRKYILVQLPEPIENNPEFKTIADVTRARITRSIEKYQYNDLGFKYFKVGSTNFPIWQVSNHDDEQSIAKQLDLFSETPQEQNYEAMLYELMLTAGMRLDWKIESKTINEHQFWIDEYKDYCFFLKPQNSDDVLNIIKNVLNEKSNDSETVVYINENYFETDQAKINFAEQLKQLGKQIKLVVV